MIRLFSFLCIAAGVFAGCNSHLAMLSKDKYDTQVALDEMRIELSDVKHTLSNTQVEMQILEDRLRSHDTTLQSTKSQSYHLADGAEQKIQLLERRIALMDKLQEKIATDIKQLLTHANQTTSSFTQYSKKIQDLETEYARQNKVIQDLTDLKGTLSTISQAIGKNTTSKPNAASYRVKAGDTLEKIARAHGTSVDALKKHNQLTSNKIVVGQEIKIPHGQS